MDLSFLNNYWTQDNVASNKHFNALNVHLHKEVNCNSIAEDKIKTLQYNTYRGDIFLNCYINNDDNCFNVEENIIHRVDDFYHMFYSEELEDYLFKVQMLKIFKDDKNIIQKIEDKQLNNYDISEEQYILIFNQYIKDMNDIFRDAPKTDKEIYLYRGISHNYIIKNIRNGIKKTSI